MSQKFHQTKEFKELDKVWKKRLEESGFQEQEANDTQLKSQYSAHYFTSTNSVGGAEAKEMYYRLAGQFLYSHTFSSVKERLIWQLHSEGMSIRNVVHRLRELGLSSGNSNRGRIPKELKDAGITGSSVAYVGRIVLKLSKEMMIANKSEYLHE